MSRKAAIEFSANVLVVIIISVVILGLGLTLFFSLRDRSLADIDNIDQQTKEQLKAVMLRNNFNVAVYPNDITMRPGDSELFTLGITNNGDTSMNFWLDNPNNPAFLIQYFATPESEPENKTGWAAANMVFVRIDNNRPKIANVPPKDQIFQGFLVNMPKDAKKGQYVIRLNIEKGPDSIHTTGYGVTKIYITVP